MNISETYGKSTFNGNFPIEKEKLNTTTSDIKLSEDSFSISKKRTDPDEPFVKINNKSNFKNINIIDSRPVFNAQIDADKTNLLEDEFLKKLKLPLTDRGLDDESDDYAFSGYPKANQKFQLGGIKAKTESFKSITGVEYANIRTLYGKTTGDKKFNFDGAAVGFELEVKQDSYLVNQFPRLALPIDYNSNYFFEVRNSDIWQNNGNASVVLALEGVKVGVRYDKGGNIGIGNVEFHDGALTTNILDFTKKYPYIAIPLYSVVAGGVVTGAYYLNKGQDVKNIDIANIMIYNLDNDKHKLKVGISPSLALTGEDKFKNAFNITGAGASVSYRYDNNLTFSVNGGYNKTDGAHGYFGSAMKF